MSHHCWHRGVVLAPAEELGAVGLVLPARIEPAALAVAGHAVALQIAEMGGRRLAVGPAPLDHAGLDDDPAGAKAHAGVGIKLPTAVAGHGGGELGAPATGIEAAGLGGCPGAHTAGLADAARISTGSGHRLHDLLLEGQRPAPLGRAGTGEAGREVEVVVVAHAENICARPLSRKGERRGAVKTCYNQRLAGNRGTARISMEPIWLPKKQCADNHLGEIRQACLVSLYLAVT